jgi:hypothetical protein
VLPASTTRIYEHNVKIIADDQTIRIKEAPAPSTCPLGRTMDSTQYGGPGATSHGSGQGNTQGGGYDQSENDDNAGGSFGQNEYSQPGPDGSGDPSAMNGDTSGSGAGSKQPCFPHPKHSRAHVEMLTSHPGGPEMGGGSSGNQMGDLQSMGAMSGGANGRYERRAANGRDEWRAANGRYERRAIHGRDEWRAANRRHERRAIHVRDGRRQSMNEMGGGQSMYEMGGGQSMDGMDGTTPTGNY